ncbi:TIGR04222 domain-containing membrane protein [Frankia sp. QA3]|uniref:TIGR04222 domain-containing membrane protein n=1 Tax=Frankia sp. QA3 TaxID=710111 RepID=UPI000269CC11|nr:TIGR04222 domain-containing membrane protein [Frankia sp. QA3]EIV96431.1 hypothetical protein FraQA3DRAFT_6328 [Frankia sp. QA3]
MAIAIGYVTLVIVLAIGASAARRAALRGAPIPDRVDAERGSAGGGSAGGGGVGGGGAGKGRSGPRRSVLDRFGLDADGLGPRPAQAEELALLDGGPALAALVGVVALYESGAVVPGAMPGTVISHRPAPSDDHDLRCAIHQEIDAHGGPRVAELGQWLSGNQALVATRARLREEGLLPTARQERLLRWCRSGALALFAGGIILLAGGVVALGGSAIVVLSLGVVGTVVLGARRQPRATAAGSTVLTEARRRLPGLADGGLSGQRALAVALFGPVALGRADRTLASGLGLLEPAIRSRAGRSASSGGCSSAGDFASGAGSGGSAGDGGHGGHGGHGCGGGHGGGCGGGGGGCGGGGCGGGG